MLQFKNSIAPNLTENIFNMRTVQFNLRNDAGLRAKMSKRSCLGRKLFLLYTPSKLWNDLRGKLKASVKFKREHLSNIFHSLANMHFVNSYQSHMVINVRKSLIFVIFPFYLSEL